MNVHLYQCGAAICGHVNVGILLISLFCVWCLIFAMLIFLLRGCYLLGRIRRSLVRLEPETTP